MTYVRTIAAITLAIVSFASAPTTDAPVYTRSTLPEVALSVDIMPLEPKAALDNTDMTVGVRIVADSAGSRESIGAAVDRFTVAGWPLENLEIKVGPEDGCGGHAGVHSIEDGHHVVEVCTNAEFVLLHELGHVWADMYLDDDRRAEWLALRELDSWHEGDHSDRGTEHVADVVAFGLLGTWHTPNSITPNDPSSLIDHFEWLFGIEPLHMAIPSGLNQDEPVVAVISKTYSTAPTQNVL
jgi:hypothetical protein